MRGGPIDLTPFGSLLTGIGVAYWVLALSLAGLAGVVSARLGRQAVRRGAGGFILPVALHVKKQGQQYDAAKEILEKLMALFQERCKTAGEKIRRTAESVKGVAWLKWRLIEINHRDPFKTQ